MKQSKLRKRRIWRYAVLYFVMLIVFLALLVGPIVAGSSILTDSLTKSIPMNLYQPQGLDNNDTRGRNETGTGRVSGAASSTTVAGTAKIRLF